MKDIKENYKADDCPLCNGLIELEKSCPNCGHLLDDGGRLESYFGPYSPYEEGDDSLQGFLPGYESGKCLHLLYCPNCGWDKRVGISKVHIEL